MRYLKNEKFVWENDEGEEKAFVIDKEGVKHDGTVAEVLLSVARAFIPQQGKPLSIDDIDHLNQAKRILVKPPTTGEHHAFETEDWNILQRVILWVAPDVSFYFLAPRIKKYLDGVLDKLPEVPKASENGHSETPVPQQVVGVGN